MRGGRRRLSWWHGLAAVVVVVAVLRMTTVDLLTVASASMEPTLCTGALIMTSRHVDPHGVVVGDLVTFDSPLDGRATVKRVVAVAGQRVGLRDAVLFVDGKPVPEPWVDGPSIDGVFSPTVTIPPDAVYVLGDAREFSIDSRAFGPLPIAAITGRVLLTVRRGCGS